MVAGVIDVDDDVDFVIVIGEGVVLDATAIVEVASAFVEAEVVGVLIVGVEGVAVVAVADDVVVGGICAAAAVVVTVANVVAVRACLGNLS